MVTLCMPMNMALSSNFQMELSAEFFHDSLHTLLIIRRSKCFYPFQISPNIYLYRVILASIKQLGQCPCPRCFIKKDQIPGLGTQVDQQRRNKIRQDSRTLQTKVEMVREWIFKQGRSLVSKAVERVLGVMSVVPVRVSF